MLHHEWMDVRRVIHMNMKEHPKDGPRSSLGHSIGHFDGDTLVIETANYSAGVLNQYVETAGPADEGTAPLRPRSRRSSGCTSTPRASGSSSRST